MQEAIKEPSYDELNSKQLPEFLRIRYPTLTRELHEIIAEAALIIIDEGGIYVDWLYNPKLSVLI